MIRTTAKMAVVTIPVTSAHCRGVFTRPPGRAAAARVHRHDEQQVDVVEDVLDEGERRRRVQSEAGQHVALLHRVEVALHVDRRLGVEGEHRGAGVRHRGDVVLGLLDHQVHVDRLVGELAERRHHVRAECQVRDEAAVHDIHVQPVGAAGQHQAHLLGEPGQVGGENAGRDADAVRHCGLRATTMSTAVPGGASVPAAGRCATTVPGLASDVRRRVTLPSCKPSTSSLVRASAWLMFSRSGTVIVASPRLITSATPAPGANGSPAGGRVSPTTPGGTRGTWIDSTCATLSPAAVIRRRATDPSSPVTSGTGILGGPALDTRVTRPSATALTPGGRSCQMMVPWGAVGWGSLPPSTTWSPASRISRDASCTASPRTRGTVCRAWRIGVGKMRK